MSVEFSGLRRTDVMWRNGAAGGWRLGVHAIRCGAVRLLYAIAIGMEEGMKNGECSGNWASAVASDLGFVVHRE